MNYPSMTYPHMTYLHMTYPHMTYPSVIYPFMLYHSTMYSYNSYLIALLSFYFFSINFILLFLLSFLIPPLLFNIILWHSSTTHPYLIPHVSYPSNSFTTSLHHLFFSLVFFSPHTQSKPLINWRMHGYLFNSNKFAGASPSKVLSGLGAHK